MSKLLLRFFTEVGQMIMTSPLRLSIISLKMPLRPINGTLCTTDCKTPSAPSSTFHKMRLLLSNLSMIFPFAGLSTRILSDNAFISHSERGRGTFSLFGLKNNASLSEDRQQRGSMQIDPKKPNLSYPYRKHDTEKYPASRKYPCLFRFPRTT